MAVSPNGITAHWCNLKSELQLARGTVILRQYDITALTDSNGGVLNPLLKTVKDMIKQGDAPMQAVQKGFLEHLENLPELRTTLNGVLKKIVLEPDPKEFDVDFFTLMEKVEIFTFAIGGKDGLAQAEKFRLEQSPVLAALQSSE